MSLYPFLPTRSRPNHSYWPSSRNLGNSEFTDNLWVYLYNLVVNLYIQNLSPPSTSDLYFYTLSCLNSTPYYSTGYFTHIYLFSTSLTRVLWRQFSNLSSPPWSLPLTLPNSSLCLLLFLLHNRTFVLLFQMVSLSSVGNQFTTNTQILLLLTNNW